MRRREPPSSPDSDFPKWQPSQSPCSPLAFLIIESNAARPRSHPAPAPSPVRPAPPPPPPLPIRHRTRPRATAPLESASSSAHLLSLARIVSESANYASIGPPRASPVTVPRSLPSSAEGSSAAHARERGREARHAAVAAHRSLPSVTADSDEDMASNGAVIDKGKQRAASRRPGIPHKAGITTRRSLLDVDMDGADSAKSRTPPAGPFSAGGDLGESSQEARQAAGKERSKRGMPQIADTRRPIPDVDMGGDYPGKPAVAADIFSAEGNWETHHASAGHPDLDVDMSSTATANGKHHIRARHHEPPQKSATRRSLPNTIADMDDDDMATTTKGKQKLPNVAVPTRRSLPDVVMADSEKLRAPVADIGAAAPKRVDREKQRATHQVAGGAPSITSTVLHPRETRAPQPKKPVPPAAARMPPPPQPTPAPPPATPSATPSRASARLPPLGMRRVPSASQPRAPTVLPTRQRPFKPPLLPSTPRPPPSTISADTSAESAGSTSTDSHTTAETSAGDSPPETSVMDVDDGEGAADSSFDLSLDIDADALEAAMSAYD